MSVAEEFAKCVTMTLSHSSLRYSTPLRTDWGLGGCEAFFIPRGHLISNNTDINTRYTEYILPKGS